MTELPGFPLLADVVAVVADRLADGRGRRHPRAPRRVRRRRARRGRPDRDGHLEIVDTDLDGKRLRVVAPPARRLATDVGRPRLLARRRRPTQDQFNRTKPGFAELARRSATSTATASSRSWPRPWTATSTPGTATARRWPGFPVLARRPGQGARRSTRVSHEVTFTPGSGVRRGRRAGGHPDGRRRQRRRAARDRGRARRRSTWSRPTSATAPTCSALLGAAGTPGNTRLYVISPDGTDAAQPEPRRPTPTRRPTCPAGRRSSAMLPTELLPTIGDGVAMPAAIGDVDAGHPGPEIVAALGGRAALRARRRRATASTGHGRGGRPARCCGPAGSALENAGAVRREPQLQRHRGVARRLRRAVRRRARRRRRPSRDRRAHRRAHPPHRPAGARPPAARTTTSSSAWDGATGDALPGSPQTTADLAFFVAPAIADLDGDGHNEVIAGNGALHARRGRRATATAPAGWPKLTGGWSVGTPGRGRLGRRRHARGRPAAPATGTLFVWHTAGTAAPAWGSYGCDSLQLGRLRGHRPAAVVPTTTTTTSVTSTTTAPSSTAPPTTTGSGSNTTAAPCRGGCGRHRFGWLVRQRAAAVHRSDARRGDRRRRGAARRGWVLLAARRRRTTSS